MQVLNRTPNQLYVEVLFDISENTAENVSLRTDAVSALRDPEYKDSTDRMLLFHLVWRLVTLMGEEVIVVQYV